MQKLSSTAAWTLLCLSLLWASASLTLEAQWQFLLAGVFAAASALRLSWRPKTGGIVDHEGRTAQGDHLSRRARAMTESTIQPLAPVQKPGDRQSPVPLRVVRQPVFVPQVSASPVSRTPGPEPLQQRLSA